MKTQFLTSTITALVLTAGIACSKSGGSDPGTVSSSSVITVNPNPVTATVGGAQVMVTPTGGVAPYAFQLQSSMGASTLGNIYPTGTYATFQGVTAGTGLLLITDSNNTTVQIPVIVSGSGTGGTGVLSITPQNPSVALGGTIAFTVGGGTPPYTYSVITSGGGYFNGNTYYAPNIAETVTIQIGDSANNTQQMAVNVGTTSGSTTGLECNGNFAMLLAGYPATLSLIENSAGQFAGSLTITGYQPAAVSGSCSGGTITFTNTYSGSVYTGSYYVNAANSAQIVMQGSYGWNGGMYSWSAVSQ